MGEFNSSRATLRNRGLITARGWGQMGRGRATALALTDYALAELAAPYLEPGLYRNRQRSA